MKFLLNTIIITIILFISGCSSPPQQAENPPTKTAQPPNVAYIPTITPVSPTLAPIEGKLPLPPEGSFYQGVFPGGLTGEEDDITLKDLRSYETIVGKEAAWVYFSNNWYQSREFPTETAEWIREAGSVPYIRLMLRSDFKYRGNETVFTLQNIINGRFDDDLHAWCREARSFGSSLLVEYGTEVNSDSFAWSGIGNGAGTLDGYGDPLQPDGPERFRDAYRHIIKICRTEQAENITWVFHADSEDHPPEPWNRMENYYPGDEWIDWIGVSIYGAYTPQYLYWSPFPPHMGNIYSRIQALAPEKPIIVAEFGTAKNNPLGDQTQWAREALTDITSSRYPNFIGFAWWNERWQNDGNSHNDTTMRVEDNPNLAAVFRELVGENPVVLGEIVP